MLYLKNTERVRDKHNLAIENLYFEIHKSKKSAHIKAMSSKY